jgi:hypothetical protein
MSDIHNQPGAKPQGFEQREEHVWTLNCWAFESPALRYRAALRVSNAISSDFQEIGGN